MAQASGYRVPRWRGPVAVVLGALAAGILGTSLHAQVLYAGDTALQLGAVGALIFSAAVATFAGLWTRSVAVSAATGVLTYVLLGAFSLDIFSGPLIVTGTSSGLELPVVTAGQIWLFGQSLATIAAVLVTAVVLRSEARFERASAKENTLPYGTDPGYRPGPEPLS